MPRNSTWSCGRALSQLSFEAGCTRDRTYCAAEPDAAARRTDTRDHVDVPKSETTRLTSVRFAAMTGRTFGEIPQNPPGTTYASRREAADSGVHRPLQGGICGGEDGAESVVVSGGYVDDLDYGDEIIYTGHGGRDSNTRLQVADQELTRGNLGLARNHLDGIPVRVIRGHQGEPSLSPSTGYRYDGLFEVSDHWHEIGKDGFRIWRFRLTAIDQTWEMPEPIRSALLSRKDEAPTRRKAPIRGRPEQFRAQTDGARSLRSLMPGLWAANTNSRRSLRSSGVHPRY